MRRCRFQDCPIPFQTLRTCPAPQSPYHRDRYCRQRAEEFSRGQVWCRCRCHCRRNRRQTASGRLQVKRQSQRRKLQSNTAIPSWLSFRETLIFRNITVDCFGALEVLSSSAIVFLSSDRLKLLGFYSLSFALGRTAGCAVAHCRPTLPKGIRAVRQRRPNGRARSEGNAQSSLQFP